MSFKFIFFPLLLIFFKFSHLKFSCLNGFSPLCYPLMSLAINIQQKRTHQKKLFSLFHLSCFILNVFSPLFPSFKFFFFFEITLGWGLKNFEEADYPNRKFKGQTKKGEYTFVENGAIKTIKTEEPYYPVWKRNIKRFIKIIFFLIITLILLLATAIFVQWFEKLPHIYIHTHPTFLN